MIFGFFAGRGGEIRTPDILVPNQARYQATLHPERMSITGQNAFAKGLCRAYREMASMAADCHYQRLVAPRAPGGVQMDTGMRREHINSNAGTAP